MSIAQVKTFEEAARFIEQQGILPLSSFIPEHPSLESITASDSWHTGTDTDPWLWRDRLAGVGIAAYGRFFAKKPMFIAADIFALAKSALGAKGTVEERYRDGMLSHASLKIYRAIEALDGIDARALRKAVGMQHKEDKNEFDTALIELQSAFNVVISGISERLNALGHKSGWNSTCYIIAENWMELHGIDAFEGTKKAAQSELFAFLESKSRAEAYAYMLKRLS
jgi:hypothetical protein